MLDEFCTGYVRLDDAGTSVTLARKQVGLDVVVALHNGRIKFAQKMAAAEIIRSDHNAIGIQKVSNRTPFAQEFRV